MEHKGNFIQQIDFKRWVLQTVVDTRDIVFIIQTSLYEIRFGKTKNDRLVSFFTFFLLMMLINDELVTAMLNATTHMFMKVNE